MIRHSHASRGSVLRDSAVYIAATGASSAVAFLLLPVLTRLLTPEDYGVLGLLTATLGILAAVVGLNPNLLVTARFAVLPREALRELVSASVPVTAVTAAAAWTVLELVSGMWAEFDLPRWTHVVLVITAAAGVFRTLGLTILQMQRRALSFAAFETGGAVLAGTLALLMVAVVGLDWRGKFIADAAVVGLLGAGAVVYLARNGYLSLLVSRKTVRAFVAYSAPLALHALGFWAINAQDRYFIAGMVGVSAVGVYTVAYSFGSILNLIHTAVQRAFNPFFYERARQGERERTEVVRFTYAYLLAAFAGWVIFVIAAWLAVPIFLGPAFENSFVFIPWISLAYTFNAVRTSMTGYLYLAERTRLIGILTGIAAVLNAALNVLFISQWGAVGAAVATAVTFAFIAGVTTVYAVRLYPMPWRSALRQAA